MTANAGREGKVARILAVVLALNLGVALAKLGYGAFAHIGSVQADGLHSLFDSVGNIVALIGMRAAGRPADYAHPYGHSKYETYASAFIGALLVLAAIVVARDAISCLIAGETAAQVTGASFAVMIATLAVNLGVTAYEHLQAKRLSSEVLAADAKHTASDVVTTLGVLAGLCLMRMGFDMADAVVSLIVAAIICSSAWSVLRQTNNALSDHVRIPPDEIRELCAEVPGVLGCHGVRTRGTGSQVYVDLHLLVDGDSSVSAAHDLASAVETSIAREFSQVADVLVHVEPCDEAQIERSRAECSRERLERKVC